MNIHFLRDEINKYVIKDTQPIKGRRYIKRTKPLLLSIFSILLSISIISSNCLIVYADSLSSLDPSFTTDIQGYNNWTFIEKASAWLTVSTAYIRTHFLPDQYGGLNSDKIMSLSEKRFAELGKTGNSTYSSWEEYMSSLWEYDSSTDTVSITPEGRNVINNAIYNGDYINNQYDNELSDNYRIGYTYDIHNFRTEVQKSDEYCNALEVLCDYVKSHNYTMLSDHNDNNYVYVYKTQFTYILSQVNNSTTYVKRYVLDSENVKQPFERLDYHYSSVSHRFELQNTATLSPDTNGYEYSYRLLNQPNIDALSNYSDQSKWYSDCFMNDSYIGYRIYDSIDDLGSGNVPWQSYYSVGDTINNFSEIYNFITNHNEEYNTYITNYYDDHDDMPSLPDIIVYIRTIVPEPTPDPSPTPTPKPNTNTSTSDGVTVTQNANPVINVIVKIKNSLFPWGDDDEDDPDPEEPTTEEPTTEEPTTEEASSEDDPTKPIKERDEDDDNPFWWLKSIFKWLKEIISDVGYIFEGIISALNSVLHAIIGQKGADGKWEGGLPTVIGDLIAYFLPFLPPEMITLLELSILLTVIVAVIHIIRK